MGFRCSLLGHDYGPSEVDRDREERGDEVVVTVHEFKTCDRCGTTKTVSENKEVTSIAADEAVPDSPDAGDAVLIDAGEADGAEQQSASSPSSDTTTGQPGAEGAPNSTDSAGPASTADATAPGEQTDQTSADTAAAGSSTEHGDEPAPAGDPPRDDAVILDDDDKEPDGDREYGEWPAREQGGDQAAEGAAREWPEPGGTDERHDVSPPGESVDEPAALDDDGELVPGAQAYPDEDAHVMTDDSGGTATEQVNEQAVGSGITSAGSAPAPDTASPNQKTAPLVCPECETTAHSRDSLRQGDICPECKRGYLTEREHNR